MKTDLSVDFIGVKLRTPIIQTSGGPYTKDGKSMVKAALAGAAAVSTKSIFPKGAKVGRPCMIQVPGGLMNCEEWSDLNYEDWINGEIAEAKKGGVPVIVHVSEQKDNLDNLGRMALGVVEAGADILEVGTYDPRAVPRMIRAVKRKVGDFPVSAKVVPPVRDIAEFGRKLEKAGANAISAIDTIGPCYAISIETGRMIMGRSSGVGRLSGPAIKPVALYHVATLARAVKIPILGIGGVWTGNDVVEMMMAGASAVGICTASTVKGLGVFREMETQITKYMERKNIGNIRDIRGLALEDLARREKTSYEMFEPKLPIIDAEKCTGCMLCVRVCGYDAIKVDNRVPTIEGGKCYGCGLCTSSCPTAALISPY